MKKILCLAMALIMSLSLVACGGSSSGGDKVTIKLATNLTEESITGQALSKFSEDISKKSDGRITCKLYFNSVLGNNNAVMEMMVEGDVQMMTVNPVTYETQIPTLATLDQYYMFDSLEHAHKFFEGEGGKYINDSWQEIGLQGMEMFALGFRELTNNKRPVSTINDLKGLTIRGYSPIQIAAWKSVGVTPTATDWNELFVSMQQGLLDGQEAALSTISDFSFYEVQKQLSMTDHVFTCDMLIASSEWLNSLSEEDRALVQETLDEAYEWHKAAYRPALDNMLDTFVNEYGVTVTELDPATKEELVTKMSEASKKEILKICDQEIYDTVQGYVEEARG